VVFLYHISTRPFSAIVVHLAMVLYHTERNDDEDDDDDDEDDDDDDDDDDHHNTTDNCTSQYIHCTVS